MARLTNPQQLENRLSSVVDRLQVDVTEVYVASAEDLAFQLAFNSPVDTSRLLSNYQLGSNPRDFTYRRAYAEGRMGNTRNVSLGVLVTENRRRAERIKAIARFAQRIVVSVVNRTPYLRDVDRRTPYVRRVTDNVLRQLQQRVQNILIREF